VASSTSIAVLRACRATGGAAITLAVVCGSAGCPARPLPDGPARRAAGSASTTAATLLSHEQTLRWVHEHRAWRLARKTKPIWARPVDPDERGRPFETADHAVERARAGYWLCVGVAGEPWFQAPENVLAKYDQAGEERKAFAFDERPRVYRLFRPKPDALSWAAQVRGEGIEGFFIRPGYDVNHPLYSPVGGYVVRRHVPDPYGEGGRVPDVWLVQQPLFESTYEFVAGDQAGH
jgi:hypothetical protein